jgi:hypothetical protein
MRRSFVILFVSVLLASAQSGFTPPRVGFIKDNGGGLRPVFGVAANFVLGEAIDTGVVTVAFSSRYGLAKKEKTLSVFDREGRLLCQRPAPRGPAVFAISASGSEALALFQQTSQVIRLWNCRASPVLVDPQDLAREVLSFAVFGRDRLAFVLRREGLFWLLEASLSTGRSLQQTALPGVSAPVLLRSDGTLLFADGEELVVRKVDGAERRISVGSSAASLDEMGDGWVHVLEAGDDGSPAGHLALRLLEDREELYRLPEAAP